MITTMLAVGLIMFLGVGVILGVGAFYSGESVPLENEQALPMSVKPQQGFFLQNWELDTLRAQRDDRALPIDLLLSEVEEHIRLEEAVAHEYVREPSEARLRASTSARFLH